MAATQRFSTRHARERPIAETVGAALAAAAAFTGNSGLDAATAARLAIIVDELVGNLLRHGQAGHDIRIDLSLTCSGGEIVAVLEDDGTPFDPRDVAEFDMPDEETGGGVGLALVRAWAEIDGYERIDGINRLELRLRR